MKRSRETEELSSETVKRRRITPNTDDTNIIRNSKSIDMTIEDVNEFDDLKGSMYELIVKLFFEIILETDIYKLGVADFTLNYISNSTREINYTTFVDELKNYDDFEGPYDDFMYENTQFDKVLKMIDMIYDEFFYENSAIDSKFFKSLHDIVMKIMETMIKKLDESHTSINKVIIFSVENICDMLTTAFVLSYKYTEDCVFKNDAHIPHINNCRQSADLGDIDTVDLINREFAMLRTTDFSIFTVSSS